MNKKALLVGINNYKSSPLRGLRTLSPLALMVSILVVILPRRTWMHSRRLAILPIPKKTVRVIRVILLAHNCICN